MFYHSGSESEEEYEQDNTQSQKVTGGDFAFSDDSDDESENRRVVSPWEKFTNNLDGILNSMQSSADQNNWSDAWEQMIKVNTVFKKQRNLLRGKPTPSFYLKKMNRFIEMLEQCDLKELQGADLGKNKKDTIKKFQRFKNKTLKGKDLPLAVELKQYRENNDIWAESEAEEDEEEEIAGNDDVDFAADDFGADDSFGDDDFEDGGFGDKDFQSGSSDDSEDEDAGPQKVDMFAREFWLKKEYQPAWMKEKVVDSKKNDRRERQERRAKQKAEASKDKKEVKEKAWDDKRVRKEVTKVLEAKGSVDRTDRKRFIESLKNADARCNRVQWRLLCKLLIIENLLDLYSSPWCLKRGAWNDVVKHLTEIVELMTEYPRYRLHIRGLRKLELNQDEKEKLKAQEEQKAISASGQSTFAHGLAEAETMLDRKEIEEDDDEIQGLDNNYFWMRGNLHGVCIRLQDDLIQAFKKSDISQDEYQERLEDKEKLVLLSVACRKYTNDVTGHRMHRLMFRHLLVKLTYEDYDETWDQLADENVSKAYTPFDIGTGTRLLENCHEIFHAVQAYDGKLFGAVDENEMQQFEVQRVKIKWETMLYLVHYLSLHHRFLLARDLLGASGLGKEQSISSSEIYIQILYNRTVARVAVAAFVHEDYFTSMTLLQRLYVTGKIKELLAQGVKADLRWKHNKTPEEIAQEQQEKQRMVPKHTFLDMDLLESVHYISSLFFEMKAILLSKGEENRAINWSFRRQWDYRKKREFLAPPENTRDSILEAGAQMLKGDWVTCLEHLRSLKCWELFVYADKVKAKVFKRTKEECLRCYLISSSKHFSDLNLDVLAEKFEISRKDVVRLCSQFIVSQDIKASIDLIGGFLVIHEPLPTQFELSAAGFHHKLSSFMSSIIETGEMFGVKQNNNREKFKKEKQNKSPGAQSGNWR